MKLEDLATFDAKSTFEADVVIVGGGPAGLTIAREFAGTSTHILVLESGLLEETPGHAALSEVESVGDPQTDLQKQKRIAFHGASSATWSQDRQPYGVRCRLLGGSTRAWAGKSAAFDPIDFAARPWLAYSGWPISADTLEPYVERAGKILNLGPGSYDDRLWKLIGIEPPRPPIDQEKLRSFFWQFSRSQLDPLDVMRFGKEFAKLEAENVRVLLNSTVTKINLDPSGNSFDELEISTIDNVRSRVKARVAVIAASGIENARLLLASNAIHSNGIGNTFDTVGRYLMDHPGARVGRFEAGAMDLISRRFGFFGLRHEGRTHMYMHGLALSPVIQEREGLLNSAVYFMGERAPDDPWDALKRLLRRDSTEPDKDIVAVLSSPKLVVKGLATKVLQSDALPNVIKELIVSAAILANPNFVAQEFQSQGLPHKVTSIAIDAITEQPPNPDSRVTLSEKVDRLGVPLPKVDWRIGKLERHTIVQIGGLVKKAFAQAGLPEPILESWVAENRPDDAVIIDMAHTVGTTRMSTDPKLGVLDKNCKVHGVHGLYVAGASTFPTSGHANPTLMIVALAIRLADHIKFRLNQDGAATRVIAP